MEKYFHKHYDKWFSSMFPDGLGVNDLDEFRVELQSFVDSIPNQIERCCYQDLISDDNFYNRLKNEMKKHD